MLNFSYSFSGNNSGIRRINVINPAMKKSLEILFYLFFMLIPAVGQACPARTDSELRWLPRTPADCSAFRAGFGGNPTAVSNHGGTQRFLAVPL